MIYPKWVYTPREDVTRENMRQYEEMYNKWYDKLYELYPDYPEKSLRERIRIREEIDKIMGYNI